MFKNLNQHVLTLLFFSTCIIFISCSGETTTSDKSEEKEDSLIIDINSIIGKSPQELSKLWGKEESKESFKNKYPCENKDCERLTYREGKYEVLFNEGKPLRITINDVPDLSSDESAITKIGLPLEEPSLKNPGTFMRWSNVNNIEEINFNTSFIYIIIKK